ncbi:hypothetical protein [Streptomyces sp. NBC_00203]|uniref:hypothetical protein n=1 Tax=Streptomyces sp. NBC_00203 TaxID=2975680 RepID=UPI00324C9C24
MHKAICGSPLPKALGLRRDQSDLMRPLGSQPQRGVDDVLLDLTDAGGSDTTDSPGYGCAGAPLMRVSL